MNSIQVKGVESFEIIEGSNSFQVKLGDLAYNQDVEITYRALIKEANLEGKEVENTGRVESEDTPLKEDKEVVPVLEKPVLLDPVETSDHTYMQRYMLMMLGGAVFMYDLRKKKNIEH